MRRMLSRLFLKVLFNGFVLLLLPVVFVSQKLVKSSDNVSEVVLEFTDLDHSALKVAIKYVNYFFV